MKPTALIELKRNTVEQSVETIERRVNALGLVEPTIQPYGDPVTRPRYSWNCRVKTIPPTSKSIIGTDRAAQDRRRAATKARGRRKKRRWRPKAAFCRSTPNSRMGFAGGSGGGWYLVKRSPVITGQDMRNARFGTDPDEPGRWETSFNLSQDGGRRFERFTQANIGNQLAVVLDNQIRSVATIESAISDSGRINGLASQEEASDLALVLRTGALPAGIHYEQERTVGPSLGRRFDPRRYLCRVSPA